MSAKPDIFSHIFDPNRKPAGLELHKYSIEQIQEALGAALATLTGQPYKVLIKDLNRHPEFAPAAYLHDHVEITLRAEAQDSMKDQQP